jgi:hypothetical protein
LLGVAIRQQCQAHNPPTGVDHTQIQFLFGSGYAGLGSGCFKKFSIKEAGAAAPESSFLDFSTP